jgi:hypothetical protein
VKAAAGGDGEVVRRGAGFVVGRVRFGAALVAATVVLGVALREADGESDGVPLACAWGTGEGPSAASGTVGWTISGTGAPGWTGPTARIATQETRTIRRIAAPPMKLYLRRGKTVLCLPGNCGPFARRVGRGDTTGQSMPLARRPMALLISFCASRAARSWRLSYDFLPLARPSSTLAYPLWK